MTSEAPVRAGTEVSALPDDERVTSIERRTSELDRRWFLGRLGIGAASLVGLRATASAAVSQESDSAPPGKDLGPGLGAQTRQARAFEVRMRAAKLSRR